MLGRQTDEKVKLEETQTSNHQNYGHCSKPKRLASTNPTNSKPPRDGREGDDFNAYEQGSIQNRMMANRNAHIDLYFSVV